MQISRTLTNTFWNPTGRFAVSIGHDNYHNLIEFFNSNKSIVSRNNYSSSYGHSLGGLFLSELEYVVGCHNS
jgi:hypothetical protein